MAKADGKDRAIQAKEGALGRLLSALGRDPVLAAALALAATSCLAVPPDSGYLEYVDTHTIILLACLMATMGGIARVGVFRAAAGLMLERVRSGRGLVLGLVMMTFFASMLVTNDVSLIAFVPLALLVLKMSGMGRASCFTVVLMTIAANLGSMLTPVGNPQNLYLFSISGIGIVDFVALMLPYAAVAAGVLALAVLVHDRRRPSDLALPLGNPPVGDDATFGPAALAPWAALFALCLLGVSHVIGDLALLAIVLVACLILDRGALGHVDLGLLLTFVAFFVFVGNVSRIGAVHDLLASLVEGRELVVSIVTSQVVSNVPAALLLSGFTTAHRALIVGTNLGGLGTLIASMASLISYKQFSEEYPEQTGHYLLDFTMMNVIFLVVLFPIALTLV